MMGIPSYVCGYLYDSVKCLVFPLVNEQGCEVSDLLRMLFQDVHSLISFTMHVLGCEVSDVL